MLNRELYKSKYFTDFVFDSFTVRVCKAMSVKQFFYFVDNRGPLIRYLKMWFQQL